MLEHTTLTTNPAKFLEKLEAKLGDKKYVQMPQFYYEGKETEYLENLYPEAPVFSPGTESWEAGQGRRGNCGTIAHIIGFAASKIKEGKLEDIIYPSTISKTGCYCIKLPFSDKNYEGKNEDYWVVIDSVVPKSKKNGALYCRPLNNESGLWGSLLEKYAATVKGNSYLELTNQQMQNKLFYGFFDYVKLPISRYQETVNSNLSGAYAVFSFPPQEDDEGNQIRVKGLITGHAFTLADVQPVVDNSNVPHELVRIDNPWLGGADFDNEYSDESDFWESNPEYKDLHRQSSATTGNWFMSWDDLLEIKNTDKIDFLYPVPINRDLFDYKYTTKYIINVDELAPILSDKHPKLNDLKAKHKPIRIKFNEPNLLIISTRWLENNNKSQIYGFLMSKNYPAITSRKKRYGRQSVLEISLNEGEYLYYPATSNMNTDDGLLEVSIHSLHEIECEYSGPTEELGKILMPIRY